MMESAYNLQPKKRETILLVLLIIVAIITIFSPSYFLIKWGSHFAVQIMFSYIIAGIFFLIFKKTKLMFACFACCAVLCLYLKQAYNTDLIPAKKTNGPSLEILHLNLSATKEDYRTTINTIMQSKADLVSIQEVTPDWDFVLRNNLSEAYPYRLVINRFDIYGISLYSKVPFIQTDTFFHKNVPNLVAKVRVGNENIAVICSYTQPPFNASDYRLLKEHLNAIINYGKSQKMPLITLGDYNTVAWSDEILDFKEKLDLKDSRRGFMPSFEVGKPQNFFNVPISHIFYSKPLKCIQFENVKNIDNDFFAIKGIYQIDDDVEKKNL